jgi:hypothetical protein
MRTVLVLLPVGLNGVSVAEPNEVGPSVTPAVR